MIGPPLPAVSGGTIRERKKLEAQIEEIDDPQRRDLITRILSRFMRSLDADIRKAMKK